MRKGARLINIGRGEAVVDERALHPRRSAAVISAAAALDAHKQEPLPAGRRVGICPNVIRLAA
jgi:phosphoglycerate dehydrogenase-like enzyme